MTQMLRPWTPEEDDLLRREYRRRAVADLAMRFGRTVEAVYKRASILGSRGSQPKSRLRRISA